MAEPSAKPDGRTPLDALNAYARAFSRDLSSVMFLHAPGRFRPEAVRNACRVMAVGILAHKLRGLIQSAPAGDGKGQRGRLDALASDILSGRIDGDGSDVPGAGALSAPEAPIKSEGAP